MSAPIALLLGAVQCPQLVLMTWQTSLLVTLTYLLSGTINQGRLKRKSLLRNRRSLLQDDEDEDEDEEAAAAPITAWVVAFTVRVLLSATSAVDAAALVDLFVEQLRGQSYAEAANGQLADVDVVEVTAVTAREESSSAASSASASSDESEDAPSEPMAQASMNGAVGISVLAAAGLGLGGLYWRKRRAMAEKTKKEEGGQPLQDVQMISSSVNVLFDNDTVVRRNGEGVEGDDEVRQMIAKRPSWNDISAES